MALNQLDDFVLVSSRQLVPDDLAKAAARGVTMIVNNRPDGEEAGQPGAAEIEAAAEAAGLAYTHIPVAGGISDEQIEAMQAAIETAGGRALLFCRTGTRSAHLWALARARGGADPASLISSAGQAGYDLRPLLPWLKSVGEGNAQTRSS